ncbi:MAG: 4-alpha-glucanotransferase, partial [Clostridia bacterium]|nr:4-alpha-glucanotransferase [Clostridia bacterium]
MRKAGVLLSISSLPSKYGIGCFSKEAYEFVDFLCSAKQSYWQILPLGPTSYGDSPYQSFSSFAGNPYYISLEDLISEGILDKNLCDNTDFGTDCSQIDYQKLYQARFGLLHTAYKKSDFLNEEKFKKFEAENDFWLDDYARFMTLKNENNGKAWNDWESETVNETEEINFWKFVQYKFFDQWKRLKKYANENGVSIIGDIPIYVSYDSVDVWKNPELFELDSDGLPISVAGCPPDGFSATGQLWGNPVYSWNEHKKDGFRWWIERIGYALEMYDALRIDHFRGFCEFYSVPYGESTAENGKWVEAPGSELFNAIKKELGERDIIAEDLGFITDNVRKLLSETGFAGMKVFEFAFDSRDDNGTDTYLPHNYQRNCIAYTETHDNEPVTSWFSGLPQNEKNFVRAYLC